MTDRRAPRVAVAIALLIVGSFLAITDALAQLAGGSDPDVTFQSGGLELSDDDNATALFSVSDMKPGDVVTRCITVNYSGDALGSVIRLHGTAAGSAANALRLKVEAGTGGAFGNCSGFSGVAAYNGALTTFSGTYNDFASGLPVLAPVVAPGTVSFRLSMSLADDAVQGATGAASFTWEAGQPVTVPPVPPVTVPPLPTIPTLVTIPETPAEKPGPVTKYGSVGPAAAPDAAPETPSAPTVEAAAPVAPPNTVPAPAPTARTRVTRENASTPNNDSVLDVIVAVATEAAKKGAFPTGLVLLVIAFLIIQDRIDRKDPKLALAPVYAEADLQFTQRGDELE